MENCLNRNYSPETLLNFLSGTEAGEMFFQVAVEDERVIGFCVVGDRNRGMELIRLYVLPEYHRQGIGKRFLYLGENFVKSKGLGGYFCSVLRQNHLGINFYLGNGFRHISEKDNGDEWYMEKVLL